MSGSNGTSQSQTTQAPAWQLPYQQLGLNQALSQYQNTQQLVSPFAPQQEQAISNITNMGTNGDPTTNAASQYIQQTLGGNVQQNPQLNALFTQGANQIQNQLATQFAGSGRNVDQSAGVNAQALGNFGANLYGNAFNTEAGLQNAALSAAPSNLQSQLGLQSALYGAGQNLQNLGQQYINAPQQFLNQYLNEVNGYNLGNTQSVPANALGTTLGGIGLGANLLFGGANGGLLGNIGNYLGGYTTTLGGDQLNTVTPYTNDLYNSQFANPG